MVVGIRGHLRFTKDSRGSGNVSISLLGPLSMRVPPITRLNYLAENSGPMVVSAEGASLATLSMLRGPPIGAPSSSDAQASPEAS